MSRFGWRCLLVLVEVVATEKICGGMLVSHLPGAMGALDGEYEYHSQVHARPAYQRMRLDSGPTGYLSFSSFGAWTLQGLVGHASYVLWANTTAQRPTAEHIPVKAWQLSVNGVRVAQPPRGFQVTMLCPGQTMSPTPKPTPEGTPSPTPARTPKSKHPCIQLVLSGLHSWQMGAGCLGTFFYDKQVNGAPSFFLPNDKGTCGSSMMPDGLPWGHRVHLYRDKSKKRWVIGQLYGKMVGTPVISAGIIFLSVVSAALSPEHVGSNVLWSAHPLGHAQIPALPIRVRCPKLHFGTLAPTPVPTPRATPAPSPANPTPRPSAKPTPRPTSFPTPSPTPPMCERGVLLRGLRKGQPGYVCMGQYRLQIVGERPVFILYRKKDHSDPCHLLFDNNYNAWVVKRVYGSTFYLRNPGVDLSPDQCDQSRWVIPHDGGEPPVPAPGVHASCPLQPVFRTQVPTPIPTPKPKPTPKPTPVRRQFANVQFRAEFFSTEFAEWRMFQLPRQDAFRRAFADVVGLPLSHIVVLSVGPIKLNSGGPKINVGTRVTFQARIDVQKHCLDWRDCRDNTVLQSVKATGFTGNFVATLKRFGIAIDARHMRVKPLKTIMPRSLSRGWFAATAHKPTPKPPARSSPFDAEPLQSPFSARHASWEHRDSGFGHHGGWTLRRRRSAKASSSGASWGLFGQRRRRWPVARSTLHGRLVGLARTTPHQHAGGAPAVSGGLAGGTSAKRLVLGGTAVVWTSVALWFLIDKVCSKRGVTPSEAVPGAGAEHAQAAELRRGEYKPLMTAQQFDAMLEQPAVGAVTAAPVVRGHGATATSSSSAALPPKAAKDFTSMGLV